MMQAMRSEMFGFLQELAETRHLVREYNGLRELLGDVAKRLAALEERSAGKAALADGIRLWSGWIVAIVGAIWAWVAKLQ